MISRICDDTPKLLVICRVMVARSALLVLGLAILPSVALAAPPPLPEGDAGIAANYPGDAGIDGDAAVVYADDFESYSVPDDLWGRYDNVYQLDQIRLATEPEHVFAGAQSLEFTVPQQDNELSNAVDGVVSPEVDVLYLRYYSKFEAPFDVVGSSHNGAMISSHYFIDGQATPGVPADGMNKFLVALENWRGEAAEPSPGRLNVYVYHPEQLSQWGDHFMPSGERLPYSPDPFDWGPDFVPRPDITPELDRWYCWEYMVQANTVGERDGRIAIWLDGALVADFHNLRFRDIDSLTIDRFALAFHIGSNPNGATRKWYDNLVVAESYIGPLYAGGGDGDGDGGDGDSGDGDGDSGSADTTDGSDGSSSDGTGTGDPGANEDAGCSCRTMTSNSGLVSVLGLLGLLGLRRRSRSHRQAGLQRPIRDLPRP
jgi:hypothetical protein